MGFKTNHVAEVAVQLKSDPETAGKVSMDLLRRIYDLVFHALETDLIVDKAARVPGFGTFRVVERAARFGNNIKTGERVEIPARRAVQFHPCDRVRCLVNLPGAEK